ncbi:hypothetical protein V7S43_007388 [Phytophthora oleae]|uniref:Ubiquitin-like protease family profile domain-containing protein n=1 Tax=Phytophthora oleae TaxID=2107226 RepID=A0ABD3FM66_9STRA
MHKWLTEEGIPSLPDEYYDSGNKGAVEITATYPHKRIEGLPDQPGFEYAMMYRATPPTWLTEASIRALCVCLVNGYPACRFARFQSVTAKAKRTRMAMTTYWMTLYAIALSYRLFDVIPQNNPIQFDAYNCGVYVCWMFIRQVVPGPALEMSANALTRRRFELFYYLLTDCLLPVKPTQAPTDDGTERKMPPPSQDDECKEADEADEVAPTQVAQ